MHFCAPAGLLYLGREFFRGRGGNLHDPFQTVGGLEHAFGLGLFALAEKRAAVEAFGKGGALDKSGGKKSKMKKKNRPGQRARRAAGASGVGALPPPPPLPWEGGERVGAGAGAGPEEEKKKRIRSNGGTFSSVDKRPRIAPPRPFIAAPNRRPAAAASKAHGGKKPAADPGEGLHPSWAARKRAADAAAAAVAASAGKAKKIVFDD